MKTHLLIAASTLALGASMAACTPAKPPQARAALDCPQAQGELTRSGVSPDGRTCTYRSSTGEEIALQLVSTAGDPQGALRGIEGQLMAGLEQAKAEAAKAAPSDSVASASTTDDAARAADEAARDASASAPAKGDDEVKIDVPGLKVEAHDRTGRGETTRVELPGIHIVADGERDEANVQIGALSVVARDDAATIRILRDVRLKGEAFSRVKRGIRATFIYTGKDLPQGYRLVGYEAGGPKMGPITVATVRSNAEGTDRNDDVYEDVKRLVRRNGGV